MKKVTNKESIAKLFKDGMSVMIGGFLSCGTPEVLIDAILESGAKDLTIIVNDTGTVDRGIGRLVVAGVVKKVHVSHIGTNPESGKLMTEGKMEVVLTPQGTLIEKIRAGGAGLGGVLTPTGLGTDVEKGKQKITVNDKEYLLEEPLRADFALIRGSIVDKMGNAFYKGTTRNFNPIIAMAANTVIVEAEKLVDIGSIEPESVMTPGAIVDHIIEGGDVRVS